MDIKQQKHSNLEKRWEDILYDMIDNYASLEVLCKDFDNNFIQSLPLLDKDFIKNIFRKDMIKLVFKT